MRSPRLASAVVQAALGYNVFHCGHPHVKKDDEVCFTTGQPLGYYCSWPLFTLSHHWRVWMAADKIDPGRVFRHYAILGDDLVIGDSNLVAQPCCLAARRGRYETSAVDETCYDGWHTEPAGRSVCYILCYYYYIVVAQADSFEARKDGAGDYCVDRH